MSHCETCRHFKPEQTYRGVTWGQCSAVEEEIPSKNALAVVESGDWASSAGKLLVHPKFGCVLWETQGKDA